MLSQSPSSAANTPSILKPLVKESPIYWHWIGIELLDLWNTQNDKVGDVEINEKMLDFLYDTWKAVKSLPEKLQGYQLGRQACTEQSLTALLARALDMYLFSNNYDCGACLHQMPTRQRSSTTEACDLYCLKLNDFIPDIPVMVCDFNKSDKQKASDETDAYAYTVLQEYYPGDSCPLLLGLVATSDIIQLKLYYRCSGHLHSLPILNVNTAIEDDTKKFLKVLFCAVHRFIQEPVYTTGIVSCSIQVKCCDGPHTTLAKNVVLCENNQYILKYYDGNTAYLNPHIDVLCNLSGYSVLDIMIDYLESSCRYYQLKMKYIKSNLQCSFEQSIRLIEILKEVHEQGIVHGDIRQSNILISEESAYLIDFDLGGKEFTNYPDQYNHVGIEERHEFARKNSPRNKIHDRYSLHKILLKIYNFSFAQVEILEKLLVKDYPLVSIIEELKQTAHD